MPSHIKHMDKMHKISVISNSSMSQLSFGISFILKSFILKNRKFHYLVWNCPEEVEQSLKRLGCMTAVKKTDAFYSFFPFRDTDDSRNEGDLETHHERGRNVPVQTDNELSR